jgi:hypothetical protein
LVPDEQELSEHSSSSYVDKKVEVMVGKRARKPAARYEPPPPDVKGDQEADRKGTDISAGRLSRSSKKEMMTALRVYSNQGVETFLTVPWVEEQFTTAFNAVGSGWGTDQNFKRVQKIMLELLAQCTVSGAPEILQKCAVETKQCVLCQGTHPCRYYSRAFGGYVGSSCAQLCNTILDIGAVFAELANQVDDNFHNTQWAQAAWEAIHTSQAKILKAHAVKGGNVNRQSKRVKRT